MVTRKSDAALQTVIKGKPLFYEIEKLEIRELICFNKLALPYQLYIRED
jgi:hypothetical protein